MTQQYRLALRMEDGFTNEDVGEDISRLVSKANELAKEHNGPIPQDHVDRIGLIIYTAEESGAATGWGYVTPAI